MRRRRGCCGCLLPLLVILLLLVALWAVWTQTRLPERVGLRQAREPLLGTPDLALGQALLGELRQAGLDTRGVSAFVVPLVGRDDNLAIVALDASRGFDLDGYGDGDAVLRRLRALFTGDLAERYDLSGLAVNYTGQDGRSVLTLAAPMSAIQDLANEELTEEEFVAVVYGEVNLPALAREVTRWTR